MAHAELRLALDRNSVRTMDADGRLHVAVTNISKANVCPYYGREIPDADKLGLKPDQVYQLYRDPDELRKAAPTSNNIQLLEIHDPVSADDPKREIVVGSTGTDAAFVAPYLQNSLVVWAADAIEDINSKAKCELSCAYRYSADMTPGKAPPEDGTTFGVAFDGRMVDIAFNHVALVQEGRAGSDVVVGDSKLEKVPMGKPLTSRKALMVKGALAAYVRPRLAADAKIDLNGVLAGVTQANYLAQKPVIKKRLTAATKGHLATDANLDDFHELLDSMDDGDEDDVKDIVGEAVVQALNDAGSDPDDDGEAEDAEMADKDDDDEDEKKRKAEARDKRAKDKAAKDKAAKDAECEKEAKDKKAMDAAIKLGEKNAITRFNAIRQAERDVQPFVGELPIAMDSAEEIYKFALDSLGIDTDGVHASAFPAILKLQSKPGEDKPRVAMDAKGVSDFAKRFPEAAAVQRAF